MVKNEIIIIIEKMIDKNMSIREMARELGIPKSTLYKEIVENKQEIGDDLLKKLENLFVSNKEKMFQKGGLARWSKVGENNVSTRKE